MNNIKPLTFVVTLMFLVAAIEARDDDQFNFGETIANPSGNGFDYGPEDWDKVTCDNPGTCLGFPDTWEGSIVSGWSPDTNICRSCPADQDLCFQHHQSPIDLKRDRAIPDSENEKKCPDWHYIKYEGGACTWEDLVNNNNEAVDKNNFFIRRHALQYTMPLTKNGELACFTNETKRTYPRMDYSKGFPDWFHLSHTDIIVPSVHTQEGKRYDAEVHLAHFYEVDDIEKNKIGKLAIFLEGSEGKAHWEFLDKLICQWREVEEQTRKDCGLPSVPDYIGCRNPLRGRTATPTATPTASPTVTPTASPTASLTVTTTVTTTMNATMNATVTPIASPTIISSVPSFPLDFNSGARLPIMNGTSPIASPITPSPLPAAPLELTSGAGIPVMNASSAPAESPVRTSSPPPLLVPAAWPSLRLPFLNQLSDHASSKLPSSVVPSSLPSSSPQPSISLQPSVQPSLSLQPSRTTSPSVRSSLLPSAVPNRLGSSDVPSSHHSSFPSIPSISMHPSVHQSLGPSASMFPSNSPSIVSLPAIECDSSIRFERVCKAGGCCDETRSATNFCTAFYDFFGQDFNAACWNCCDEPKIASIPVPQHPVYERIECSAIDNPNRICKSTSCCNAERSSTNYCKDVYQTYPGDLMGSICWYCCSEPKEVGPPLARNLRVVDKSRSLPEMLPDNRHFSVKEIPQILLKGDPDEDVFDEENPFANSAHADERMTRLVVDDSNRKQFDRGEFGGDEVAYMKAQIETFRKKEALTHEQRMERHLMNYDHISFNAYEWMLAVKTEYYFRYEGTFATPPCSETVHWRIMKDPIQVHPDQIKELERLLAWRIAPKGSTFKECQRDTAGKDRPGREGNAVDLNRPIQSTKPLHRMVFCECQDWRSKFEEDRRWCRRGVKTRLYEVPYGFSEVLPIVANRTIALNGTYF